MVPTSPSPHRHTGDVDRFLRQTACGEQFEHAFAQKVDRANLAIQAFPDHLHHGVELGLRMVARCHHIMEAG